MNIKDIGIIIGHKALKETSSIITVLTKHHGMYSGIISRKSKQKTSIYQAGNLVDFFWQARLHEDIGLAKCELIRAYSSFVITDKSKLYALNSIISLIKRLFHERQEHAKFFEKLELYIKNLVISFDFKQYIDMELEMLTELGYGLDLTKCAKTGSGQNLYYVSPKSGKAVSKNAGEAYKDKLLLLPQFLLNQSLNENLADNMKREFEQKKQALDLTGYFLNRYLFHDQEQPEARANFINHILS